MSDFIYQTSTRLREIEQDLMPNLIANRPIFEHLPIENLDESEVIWEQEDNYIGLQQLRGLNGAPPRVHRVGFKRYRMEPGYYGEHVVINEAELTRRRVSGTFGTPINVEQIVLKVQNQLLQRRLDRLEYIGWLLLSTGTFAVATPEGGIMHTDTFVFQSFVASTAWSNLSSSTPLGDLRTVKTKHRGHSVMFDSSARAYMNANTYNNLAKNNNSSDLFGRRTKGLETIQSLKQINEISSGDDLPNFIVYDKGYIDDNGNFQLFIPDNTVVVIGKRPGGMLVGKYTMTRFASNPDSAPGAFMAVEDSAKFGNPVPRYLKVIDAHNGGPTIEFPSSVVIMSV